MKTVLVFKTSVTTATSVASVKPVLDGLMTEGEQWNFDLEDCDHILRVEASRLQAPIVIKQLQRAGFACSELE
jgi:hypothetical protein